LIGVDNFNDDFNDTSVEVRYKLPRRLLGFGGFKGCKGYGG
jgi:hypothetical protein